MWSSQMFGLVTLLVMASGCTPIADNNQNQRREETPQASPVLDQGGSSGGMPTGDQGGSTSAPFIAEAKAVFPVINLLSPGRLDIVDGCLTVTVKEGERATAVFPPGVKPQTKGNEVVAVSFEGRTIPLGQETSIPGGLIDLPASDLVKPIPSYCPQTLFGLGG